ncbi:HET-domain-containing protein [Xylaria telfairii]|nr:HET-domain-containing protein [Xylaria telfairii]
MESTYQYLPLSTNNQNFMIRVLELSPGDFDNPVIRVKLRSTSLQSVKSQFEAVSYAWGDSTPCKTINFEGSNAHLHVAANCYRALRHLRNPVKSRILWIDAICINQNDIPERNCHTDQASNLQLLLMGHIYGSASNTVVFLGYNTEGSRFLFQHLAEADRLIPLAEEPGQPLALREPSERITREIEILFQRPWFSRVWVIQEVNMAERVIFMCGSSIATIEALMSCLQGHERNLRLINKFPAPLQLYHSNFRDMWQQFRPTPARKLYLLAVEAGLCESSNPRDRILALLPLIDTPSPGIVRLADYSREVESIFHEFALLFLPDGGLSLLWMIRHPHKRRMPSWVPDWTQNRGKTYQTLQIPDFFDVFDPEDPEDPKYDRDYENHEDYRDFDIEPVDDAPNSPSQRLYVKGLRSGRIQDRGPIILINQENIQAKITAVRALIADLESMRHGSDVPGWPDSIAQAFRNITTEDLHDLLKAGLAPMLANQEISYDVTLACHESRIFITSEGDLGLSSQEIQHGDLVCLIKGAIEPCILRERSPDLWSIISGECILLSIERGYRESGRLLPWMYITQLVSGREEQFTIC